MTQLLSVVRGAYGIALCCAPGALIGLAGGPAGDQRARAVARILGARHVTQAVLSAARPNPAVLAAGAGADALHAASMAALALPDTPCRRIAGTDALIAAAFAMAGIAIAAGPAAPFGGQGPPGRTRRSSRLSFRR
jgi:hypothetical protein